MNPSMRRALPLCAFPALLATACPAAAQSLVLKNAFIEKYKNRVTIAADFQIDHAHKKPNPISRDGEDGDLHFSGRAPVVGLPMVAEIVNAAAVPQQPAVTLVHAKEGASQPVPLAGVWRLWFEHPPKGHGQQLQGNPVPVPKNTNPDHVFEIHPITQVGGVQVRSSFVPIPNFEAYDAQTAFHYYESIRVTMKASATATLLSSVQARYNYADFVIELQGPPQKVEDGWMVLATVFDREGNPVVANLRRMVFAKETPAAQVVQSRKKGDKLRVLGIPRINLERISFLLHSNGGNQVEINLPYEMIVVGAASVE